MKIFISIISLLIGIMLGAAITAFLIVKKNLMIRENLCKDFAESENSIKANPLSGLFDSSFLKNNLSDINKNLQEQNPVTEKNLQNNTTDTTVKQLQELPSAGPGGCKTEDECLSYCSKLDNLKECLDFAKEYMGETNER
ncbi:hypothetical protein A2Y83_04630 [Candidatus Falkowbacteria bacterium RBG_13_39_14]|uniref:Uncharacterized protein n=1 Tax=Candidatus Falkowbacteria bacterium RBG_13_39_14 TaxID=1797985 RepID=A0A1F5S142_9BACT|nr:MAG: hypothetical protein A2Y83_04630 [Candidatus Falkowbacteria bacterium RBG_13_39_14]